MCGQLHRGSTAAVALDKGLTCGGKGHLGGHDGKGGYPRVQSQSCARLLGVRPSDSPHGPQRWGADEQGSPGDRESGRTTGARRLAITRQQLANERQRLSINSRRRLATNRRRLARNRRRLASNRRRLASNRRQLSIDVRRRLAICRQQSFVSRRPFVPNRQPPLTQTSWGTRILCFL